MAIGNLRDKLLKAGLVDKKQKQQADTQERRDKKQKTHEQLAAEEAERQRQFEAKKAEEAEAQRRLDAEREAERAKHEAANRIRNICDRWSVRSRGPGDGKRDKGGPPRRFYFVKRSRRIGFLVISDLLYDQLLLGALAVVERDEDDTHVL
jgi:uncharacterized protein YaiL (DUF2058 family)